MLKYCCFGWFITTRCNRCTDCSVWSYNDAMTPENKMETFLKKCAERLTFLNSINLIYYNNTFIIKIYVRLMYIVRCFGTMTS